jgi:hypothetical protein
MNNFVILNNLLRFLIITFIQVTILKNASDTVPLLDVFIYPIIILMLPFGTPNFVLLPLAFVFGLIIDAFYNCPGVHASVFLVTAFLQPFYLQLIKPRGGYETDDYPTKKSMGAFWFFQYIGVLMFIHVFLFFLVFGLSFSFDIILRILFSYAVSMIVITLYTYLFNPKY